MPPHQTSHNIPDALLAGGLVAAPAWASWLTEFNQLLTTATLILGLVFGVVRLWLFCRDYRRSRGG